MAILKICKPHLPYVKSDLAETWWEAFGRHWGSELIKAFLLRYLRWSPRQSSWRSSIVCSRSAYALTCCPLSVSPSLTFHIFDISSRIISCIEMKLGGRNSGYMEIKNCQNCCVPYSRWPQQQSSWKSSNHICSRTFRLSPKLVGDIWATWRFKIAKLSCSDIEDGRHLEFFKQRLLLNFVKWSGNLMRDIERTWRPRIAKIIPFRYLRCPPLKNR